MATEQEIEDTDAVISDNDTSTVFPDGTDRGDIDASGNPYDNPYLLHRPHAFALMHGDGGAKIAYGQLLWRMDTLIVEGSTAVGSPPNQSGGDTEAVGQGSIEGLNVKVPTIGSAGGISMSPNINDIDENGTSTGLKYHQLDSYGDVYLYWTTDLDAVDAGGTHDPANRVDACWVQVGATPAEEELGSVNPAPSAFDRTSTTTGGFCPTESQKVGTYRVLLGTVNEGEQIKQYHSSDVFWSILLLKRTGGIACDAND
tara:strand:- start:478 stop:1248 length:771 start_codon:yes stop_codon:yes gene_type:complete